jgi:hypothetical protein
MQIMPLVETLLEIDVLLLDEDEELELPELELELELQTLVVETRTRSMGSTLGVVGQTIATACSGVRGSVYVVKLDPDTSTNHDAITTSALLTNWSNSTKTKPFPDIPTITCSSGAVGPTHGAPSICS